MSLTGDPEIITISKNKDLYIRRFKILETGDYRHPITLASEDLGRNRSWLSKVWGGGSERSPMRVKWRDIGTYLFEHEVVEQRLEAFDSFLSKFVRWNPSEAAKLFKQVRHGQKAFLKECLYKVNVLDNDPEYIQDKLDFVTSTRNWNVLVKAQVFPQLLEKRVDIFDRFLDKLVSLTERELEKKILCWLPDNHAQIMKQFWIQKPASEQIIITQKRSLVSDATVWEGLCARRFISDSTGYTETRDNFSDELLDVKSIDEADKATSSTLSEKSFYCILRNEAKRKSKNKNIVARSILQEVDWEFAGYEKFHDYFVLTE